MMDTPVSRGHGWTTRAVMLVGVGVSLLFAGVMSVFASGDPDGLERVANDHGFISQARDSATAVLPTADYGIAGVSNTYVSTGLSGVLGVGVVMLVAFALFAFLAQTRRDRERTQ